MITLHPNNPQPIVDPHSYHTRPNLDGQPCSLCGYPKQCDREHKLSGTPNLWMHRHRLPSGRWGYCPVTVSMRPSSPPSTSCDRTTFADKQNFTASGAIESDQVQEYVSRLCNAAASSGVDQQAATMRLADFVDKVYRPLRLRNRSENSIRLYYFTLRKFELFLGRHGTLGDLNDDTIAAFMAWRLGDGLSPHTVNQHYNHFMAIWRFANRKRLIATLPDIEPNVAPQRTPEAWTLDQIQHLYEVAGQTKGSIGTIPAGHWWQALLAVLYDTAERIAAVLLLEWENVDIGRGWVKFPAETRKGSLTDKTFKLRPESIEALQRIALPARSIVFPWTISRTYLWTLYGNILTRAGLPNNRRSKFHRIRRTVASYYKAAGGDATELLGHSRRSVTDAYIDPRITGPRQTVDLLPALTRKELVGEGGAK